MDILNLLCIGVEKSRIDYWCSLKNDFIKLIDINILILLCLIIDQNNLCHNYVCGC